jgi:hypothetical protein
MFGKLNKLKQATKFAKQASKGFKTTRRNFLKGLGSLALSSALPGGVKIAPAIKKAPSYIPPWVNGMTQTLGRVPLHGSNFNFTKLANGSSVAKLGSKVKKVYGGEAKETYFKVKTGADDVRKTDWDDIVLTEEPGQTSITWKNKDYDHGNDQHIVIDHKNKETRFVDDNWSMEAGGEDIVKDDWIEYSISPKSINESLAPHAKLGAGEKLADDIVDYHSVNDMDNYYADTFKEYVDSFSPSGNIFNTSKSAKIKLNKEVAKKETDALNWEEQFRGGSLHGFNIGGAVNKLRTVGSLTKGLKPAISVGNISKGQMKLAKPKGNDLSGVRTDLYEGPQGPFSITDESGVRILDREFETLDSAQLALKDLAKLRTQDASTFKIFGARPAPVIDPLTKQRMHIGATEIVQEDASRMPAMFWKSRETIAEANQNVMSGRQWLAYIKNRGVGDTELKDTSLGYHLLTNGDVKMTKHQLLKEFDELAPQIDVKMLGLRDVKSTIKDVAKFIDSVRKSPPIYMDSKSRRMVNSIYKTMKRINIDRPTNTQMEIIKGVVNKNFKAEFGIDQIIGKGFDPNIKMPFMAKKMALVFDDVMNQGGLKYKAAGKPKHAGDQTMSGGTNYQEMLFSYKPGKLRTSEPLFTEGHDFGGQKPENMFVWVRFSDRTDEYGRKLLFIEEIQSDMHQSARAKGTFSKGYSKRGDLYDPDSVEIEKIQMQLLKIQDKIDQAGGLNVVKLRKDQAALIKKSEKLKPGGKRYKPGSDIPEGPLSDSKDHGRFVLQYLLRAAKESGDYDGIALASSKVKGESKSGFYDKIMIPQMKKISKKSGAKFDETVIVDADGMPYDEIPVLLLRDKKGIVPTLETSVYNRGGFVSGGLEPIVSPLT